MIWIWGSENLWWPDLKIAINPYNEKVHVIDNTRQRLIHINQFNQIVIIILFDSIFKRMYYLGTAADLLKYHQGLGILCVF